MKRHIVYEFDGEVEMAYFNGTLDVDGDSLEEVIQDAIRDDLGLDDAVAHVTNVRIVVLVGDEAGETPAYVERVIRQELGDLPEPEEVIPAELVA